MQRRKNPIGVILSLTLLGALLTAIARFGYLAHLIVQAGESLNSVPLDVLLVDVMDLHRAAIYGAVGGAILGVILVVIDLFRYGGQGEDYTWKVRDDEFKPFAEDEVKARRMQMGDRYMKEHGSKGQGGDSK